MIHQRSTAQGMSAPGLDRLGLPMYIIMELVQAYGRDVLVLQFQLAVLTCPSSFDFISL